jgi:hypothetical protein
MRYVIDKDFNNIAYMDISMIDKREKVRIINYAFRMVYYIRGKNKELNFDLDGYFKDSQIIDDEYFLLKEKRKKYFFKNIEQVFLSAYLC